MSSVDTNFRTRSFRSDSAGNLLTVQAGAGGGEDISADTQRISNSGTPLRISSATTTLVAAGRGVLKALVVEVPLTGIVTIYDNTSAAGTILHILPVGWPAGVYPFGDDFTTGITIVTAAADRLTVTTGK